MGTTYMIKGRSRSFARSIPDDLADDVIANESMYRETFVCNLPGNGRRPFSKMYFYFIFYKIKIFLWIGFLKIFLLLSLPPIVSSTLRTPKLLSRFFYFCGVH